MTKQICHARQKWKEQDVTLTTVQMRPAMRIPHSPGRGVLHPSLQQRCTAADITGYYYED